MAFGFISVYLLGVANKDAKENDETTAAWETMLVALFLFLLVCVLLSVFAALCVVV